LDDIISRFDRSLTLISVFNIVYFTLNILNSGWQGNFQKIISWLEQHGAGVHSLSAAATKKESLKHRWWNSGDELKRELVPCVDGNDKKRQQVSANIFSTKNIFPSNQDQEDSM
jgi:hypothetical protein